MNYKIEQTEDTLSIVIDSTNYKLDLGDLSNLTDFQKYLLKQGALALIRVRLSACKGSQNRLNITASKLVKIFDTKLPLKVNERQYILKDIHKAYAIVKSKQDKFSHYLSYLDNAVAKEVTLDWLSLSKQERNKLRSNPYIVEELKNLSK